MAAAYELEADSLEVEQARGRAVFTGNVRVFSDTRQIKANRLEVFFSDELEQIHRADAYGEVELTQEGLKATASYMSYSIQADTVVMQGEARVEEERGEFRADWMWIDLAGEDIRMEGNIKGKLFDSGGEDY